MRSDVANSQRAVLQQDPRKMVLREQRRRDRLGSCCKQLEYRHLPFVGSLRLSDVNTVTSGRSEQDRVLMLERMLELRDKVDIARYGGIASSAEVRVGDADRLGLGGGDIASGSHGCGCEGVRGEKMWLCLVCCRNRSWSLEISGQQVAPRWSQGHRVFCVCLFVHDDAPGIADRERRKGISSRGWVISQLKSDDG